MLNKKKASQLRSFFVRIIGLEPTRLAAPDPKSGMSTNFTISACNCGCKYSHIFQHSKQFLKKIIHSLFSTFVSIKNKQINGKYQLIRSTK
jgi:hypothetical protein